MQFVEDEKHIYMYQSPAVKVAHLFLNNRKKKAKTFFG